ncbi:DUF2842 domain-containing protein [Roseobacter sp. HKCCD9010]|jgi:hypothetical protein|uniref:DUF2842 domain-containing protein n=1 Tax=Rhodobacterales TaxID=204455 RepID=UPI00119B163B|nr:MULTISPECIES: DUF2842 domain-containing protein [Rhodobacterales]MBF9051344.1 DUF2842 domain-containing protein [Rhodobacterales bacterium HKCCD4356]NNV13391.1 DUF2842 domain-containing protein [Roseobacter sp. HKCCD7357]NNV17642.1 DUF2842 domain-containing protein [Roseobacter sp. HKCCD8768]NNV27248.1 DUF2842 domain-containing protein [Roseobacter sp. HKCCD8192]NNV31368.1 DUF2842 domain-containing protein [Roseobacter sp. HKCCD9061]
MALSYKTRRRLSLLILLVGLPVYIGLAWFLVSLFERPSIFLELAIYVVLGILWALPFKAVFKGVGQADPDASSDEDR